MIHAINNNDNEYSIVMTAVYDRDTAKLIARVLVEKKLAACVQIFPIDSIYTWNDEITEEMEYALHIKSKTSLFRIIKSEIEENHPYKIPEIIQVPITMGAQDYLLWIGGATLPYE